MSKLKPNNLFIFTILILLTLGLSISLQSLLAAWTSPSLNPPLGNTDAPLTQGSLDEAKLGGLVIGGNLKVGNDDLKVNSSTHVVGIGTTTPQHQLHIYNQSTNAEIDIQSTFGTGAHWGIYNERSDNSLRFWRGSNVMIIDGSGNLNLTGVVTANSGNSTNWNSAFAHIATDADINASNEIQALGVSANTITLSLGGGAITAPYATAAGSDSTWTLHNNYPVNCPGGQYVSAIGDTLTCSTPTGSISGAGTNNYITKWTGASSLGNSVIYDNGTNVGIGTVNPGIYKLNVSGDIYISGSSTATGMVSAVGGNSNQWNAAFAHIAADADTNASNEIQTLGTSGNTITLTGGGSVTAPYAAAAGSDSTWTLHNSYPAACPGGQYVTAIGDTLICATPAGGVEVDGIIGNEVTGANGTTLSRSGSGTAVDPYLLAINLANANTWTGAQTFNTNVTVGGTITATGGNSTQWNTAYTHSQSTHVGLTGANASGTWGINITGSAGSVAWGSISGKPLFAVNYINDRVRAYELGCGSGWASTCDANTDGYIDYANSAGSATNADTVDGQHFAWSNWSNSPTYLWASDANGSGYLAARGSISVNYANSAGSAPANGGNSDTVDGYHISQDLSFSAEPVFYNVRFNGSDIYGTFTKYTGLVDNWFRLVRDNARTTMHDLAVGAFFAAGYNRFDLAEMTPVDSNDDLKIGYLVSTDPTHGVRLHRTRDINDPTLIGVVSNSQTASMVIGGDSGPEKIDTSLNNKPIALAGRVVTLVNLDGGNIKIGDPITSSKDSGIGMKAIQSGTVVSKSMESFDGKRVNSIGVQDIVNKLKVQLQNEKPETSPYKNIQSAINDLTVPLPKNTGRIITFVSVGYYNSKDDAQAVKILENKVNSLEQEIIEIKKKIK
jgi:hypothetical protein